MTARGAGVVGLICALCLRRLGARAVINNHHHERLRSEGGTETTPVHAKCHRKHHSENNQFAEWGRRGGVEAQRNRLRWITTKNLKDSSAYWRRVLGMPTTGCKVSIRNYSYDLPF